MGTTNSEKLLLLSFDLTIESSFFLRLHLLAQIHDCLSGRLRLYPARLAVRLWLVLAVPWLPVCALYGRALQPISRVNQTARYRLPREVRSVKVMPTRKAPTMEKLTTAI